VDFRLPGDTNEPNNYWCFGVGSFLPTTQFDSALKSLGLPTAIVSTGASFGPLTGKSAEVFDSSKAQLIEMESAAIGEVCALLQVPLLVFKGVTDYIDPVPIYNADSHADQFAQHLAPVSELVAATVSKVLHSIHESK